MLKEVLVVLTILISFPLCKPEAFGPYDMRIISISACSGPKPKSCTKLELNVTGDATVYLNFQVLKTCSPTKGKILSLSSSGKVLSRFHMSKPCDHLFLRPLFDNMFNATKTCQVLKGDYSKKVDIGLLAGNYFAGSFIYGNHTFRAQFYNDECNFGCTLLAVSMTPKKLKV